MKLLILYYSGTNNTSYTMEQLANKLILNNHIVEKYNVLTTPYSLLKKAVDMAETIIFAYPIYAFNTPDIFIKKIKALKITNHNYYIVKNSGEPLKLNNASSNRLIKTLKRNKLLGEYHLLMPYNIMFRHHESMVKLMLKYNNWYLDKIVNDIENMQGEKIRRTFTSVIVSKIGFIQIIGGKINGPLCKVDDNLCIKCHKCINNCPVNNIEIKDNKLILHNKCIMCMNCFMNCPTKALKGGIFNKWLVYGKYDFNNILTNENIKDNYLEICSKKFYKYYHKYYEHLDQILKKKD